MREHGEPLNFIVPTGNLGNACAALPRAAHGPADRRARAGEQCQRRAAALLRRRATTRRRPTRGDAGQCDGRRRAEQLRAPALLASTTMRSCARRFARIAVDDATITRHDPRRRRSATASCPARTPPPACTCSNACASAATARPWAVVATAHPAKFESIVEPLVGHAVDAAAGTGRDAVVAGLRASPWPPTTPALRERLAASDERT